MVEVFENLKVGNFSTVTAKHPQYGNYLRNKEVGLYMNITYLWDHNYPFKA